MSKDENLDIDDIEALANEMAYRAIAQFNFEADPDFDQLAALDENGDFDQEQTDENEAAFWDFLDNIKRELKEVFEDE